MIAHMVFVNTSLEVALERNSSYRERTVPEYIAKKELDNSTIKHR